MVEHLRKCHVQNLLDEPPVLEHLFGCEKKLGDVTYFVTKMDLRSATSMRTSHQNVNKIRSTPVLFSQPKQI